jgi:hypothetical protein
MRVIDADAHFHEPVDWLVHADPALAAELPPPPTFGGAFVRAAGGVAQQMFPADVIPDNPIELVMWSAAEDLGMVAYVHLPFGRSGASWIVSPAR